MQLNLKIFFSCVIAVFLFFLNSNKSIAQNTNQDLQNHIRKLTSVIGNFEQKKHIKILKLPLLSYGVFSYKKEDGLIWQTLRPIESMIKITEKNGTLSGKNENSLKVVTSSNLISEIFLGVLSGNMDKIDEIFQIKDQQVESGWELLLIPKSKRLGDYISTILISGKTDIESITLNESSGDITEIALHVTESQ